MNSLISSKFTCFFFLFLFLFGLSSARILSSSSSSSSNSSSSSPSFQNNSSIPGFYGQYSLSDFRLINRRSLLSCVDPNPYIGITIDSVPASGLSDNQDVTVTVYGVLDPAGLDWVGMISPTSEDISDCLGDAEMYLQTGDDSSLPLLCQYPVKAQYVSNDPNYLSCSTSQCQEHIGGLCTQTTCNGSLTFNVVNIRTDIYFVFFTNGFTDPCILSTTNPVSFANPNSPLYGHLSSVDSTGKSMRLTWVSGDENTQQIQYGNGYYVTSDVSTFTSSDMCGTASGSPAVDFGWHDPGYIHTAIMTGLQPSTTYTYSYGSESVGWSDQIEFTTPPAGGSAAVNFIAYGDMGKAPFDDSVEHYINPGSISTSEAVAKEVASGNVDTIFHIGDISYATGFLVEWDFFLSLINPIASHVSYMTAIGNHERDYPGSGSYYQLTDSGGECGVPYETYFPLPTSAPDEPWYSIEEGPVHFTVISTEHDWSSGSVQYEWMESDMGSVDRSVTPWLIFLGHRPMYSSLNGVEPYFVQEVEPLLYQYQVDLALFGHVHNYERTCAVYQSECLAEPTNEDGIDTYDSTDYSAPVYAVIGMAGFSLEQFPSNSTFNSWSIARIAEYGYLKVQATVGELSAQMVTSSSMTVQDSFRLIKN